MEREGKRIRIHNQGDSSNPEIIDRISALPDFQILHILSFLPMKDVFRTSVLAKRWKNLWTRVDTFSFICTDNPPGNSFKQFIKFVNNTLIQNRCTRVRKFSISCEVSDVILIENILSTWIRFATGGKVKELNLNLEDSSDSEIMKFYPLPIHLYSNLSLQKLKLRNSVIESSHMICWNSLETLVMENMEVDQKMMENVFSGCPMLQEIVLRDLCGHMMNFKINSKSLRKIVLDHGLDFDIHSMHIDAPNLQEFHIYGIVPYNMCPLRGLQSCVQVYFNLVCYIDFYGLEVEDLFKFFNGVQHVQKLTLGLEFLKALSIAQLKGFKSQDLRCTHLTLESYISMSELPGILWLLQSANHLETLVVNMVDHPRKDFGNFMELFQPHKGESYLNKQKNMRFLMHLKYVKIVECRGHRNSCEKSFERELVEFILKYGKSLENIHCDSGRVTRFSKSTRASPNANIIFS